MVDIDAKRYTKIIYIINSIKKNIINMFAILILLIIVYTIILSQIDAGGPIQNQTIKSNQGLLYFSNNVLFLKNGSSNALLRLNLQGTISSAARWVGYSSFHKGVLFIDDMSDRLGVLQIDAKMQSAKVSSDISTMVYKGEWCISDDKLYNVKISGGSLFVDIQTIDNNSMVQEGHSINVPFPTALNKGLGGISRPSVCENLLVVSIASKVYLIDINTHKMKLIETGKNPVFLNKDTLVYAKELNDPNCLSVETYSIKAKKYKIYAIWRAKGLARLPVLIPMVPLQRPDDINRIETMNYKNILLVEVTRHNYGFSYFFEVDLSKNTSFRLPYSPHRSSWSFYEFK